MFDKYATENLDFQFIVVAASNAIDGEHLEQPHPSMYMVAEAFMRKIAPEMSSELVVKTAAFIVSKSAFHSNFPGVRAPIDACAAAWEEYPLPTFDWPWPELEQALIVNSDNLPKCLRREARTAYGDRDVDQWRNDIFEKPDAHWLALLPMQRLRQFQKEHGLGPAKTKLTLIEAIANLHPLPEVIQVEISHCRNDYLRWVDEEERKRRLPLSELYKRHLLEMVQTRVDSFFAATRGWHSPAWQREEDEKRLQETAKRQFEDAKHIDLMEKEHELRNAFTTDLGHGWEDRKAAKQLYARWMDNAHWSVTATLDDFIAQERDRRATRVSPKEISLLKMQTVCPLCHDRPKLIDFRSPDDLPPYHVLCTCPTPIWTVDFDYETESYRTTASPLLEKAIHEFIQKNMAASGFGIRIPTLPEFVALIEVGIQEEENEKMRSTKTLFNTAKRLVMSAFKFVRK